MTYLSQRLLGSVLLLAAVLLTSSAYAQQPSVSLDRFRPGETPEDDFHMSRPTDLGHLRFGAQLHFDYALNPLVWERTLGDLDTEQFSIVQHELVATAGLSLGLFDRVVVFAGLPVVLLMEGEDGAVVTPLGVAPADDAGLGDVYLGGRVRLIGDEEAVGTVGFQLTVTLPTGAHGTQSYRSEDHVAFHPEVLAELRPGAGSRVVLNLGAFLRDEDNNALTNIIYRHALTFGAGFAMPVWRSQRDPDRHLDIHAQIYGETAFAFFFEREQTNLEATFGAKYFDPGGLTVGLAAGPGLSRGFGTPDLRVIAMVGSATPDKQDSDRDGLLDDVDRCPEDPEDRDGFEDENGCPDPDNDGDQILDVNDRCPMMAEVVNDFEDEDGCPDEVGDQDGDGILNHLDSCPEQPEDQDGFEDEDGCDDTDNDQDGVSDGADECRDEAGVVENRGCPDSDRDGDTVVDRVDNCPDVAGTVENHGCQEEQRVVIQEGRLEILDKVYFRTNRDAIQQRSFTLLRNVAAVLNNHPEIERIQVEGHTDARGGRDYNTRLSQRRAEAVVRFLVQAGVEAGRLTARGFGPDRPIVENASTPEDHAQNRRVEFNIAGEASGAGDSSPSDQGAI